LRIGRTLSIHIGWQLAKWIVVMFAIFIFLMIVFDFTQLAPWIGSAGFDFKTAVAVSALRGPGLAESMLPFAVLFAAMAAFFQLNRRLEFTVTRAAGVSAWQILVPATIVALVTGLLAATLYNPGAAALREWSVSVGGFGGGNSGFTNGGEVWLSQSGNDGPSIIGAARTAEGGTVLANVTAFQFNDDGTLRRRVDATRARLVDHEWVFERPVVTELGQAPRPVEEFSIHTNLSLAQIRESLADPATLSFWRLPGLIQASAASSLPANDLRLRWQELLSLPLLLVAMILIGAVVSLRFSRTLTVGRLIVAGVTLGFVLYFLLVVSKDLGRGGVLSPVVAAWAPVLLAMLASASVLLREEDG
jgi:lipopolysaccharide export system permease protein